MSTPELELDPRLLTFAEQLRARSDYQITIEDDKLIVGIAPNCAVLYSDEPSQIWVTFHRECHPLSVVTALLILLDTIDPKDLNFADCFLSDVKGVLSYESEPGFGLLHIQYLRDILGLRSKNVFTA